VIASLGKLILLAVAIVILGGVAFLSFKDVNIPTRTVTKTIPYQDL